MQKYYMGLESNMIGVAGEYRVISELILRGHYPAKPLSVKRADLILENGTRLEIKTSRFYKDDNAYKFDITYGHGRVKIDQDFYDYLICWCLDVQTFFIVPSNMIDAQSTVSITLSPNSKYAPYREAWNLLEKER